MAKVERAGTEVSETQEPGRAKLPLPGSKTLSITQLLEYWNGTAPEFRPRLIGYLYRHWPIIVRTPAYIEKFANPPTNPEIILRQWGTGSYELKLSDMDKPRGGEVCRARFKFEESFTEYEPVVEILELDQGHRENRTFVEWLRSKGKLKMPGDATGGGTSDVAVKEMAGVLRELLADARASRQGNNKDGVESAYAKISEMFTSANKTVLEMVLGQFKQNSPQDFLGLLTAFKEFSGSGTSPLELLKVAKEMFAQPKPSGGDEVFTKFILDQLSEERKANRELMSKLLERKEESGDALAQIEKIGGVISAVRELGGEGGGSRAGKWGWLQDIAAAAVAPGGAFSSLVGPLATWGLAKMSGWKPGQPAPGAPPQPGAPPVQPPPPGLPGAPPPQHAAVDPQEQFMADQLMNLFSLISMPLLNALKKGQTGDMFADYVTDNGEGGVIDMVQFGLIKSVGRDRILELLRSTPQAWQMLGPIEAQFTKFLDEFLAWEPQAEGAEG